jgi:putative oxidoreductase
MSSRVETLPTAGRFPALGILSTSGDPVATLSRLVLALVMFPHGAQKVLGWFGGYGFAGTMQAFTEQMGIPAVLAFLAIAVEFLGPIALVLGLGSRIAAAGIAINMAVAVWMVHLPNGFFMNWFGNQKGEGFEYHLLAIALALVVVIRGSGAWSLDRRLA